MENKNVGYLLIGITAVIVVIILIFNNAMKDIVATNCGDAHTPYCPMNKTIENQTWLSIGIAGLVALIGLFLIFSKPNERVVVKRIKEPRKEYDVSDLRPEEKQVFKIIQSSGAIFQAELIEKTGFGKAKMTRIIDKLEGNGLVERKRRGMTNVVVIKE